jgi:hypothetical protein
MEIDYLKSKKIEFEKKIGCLKRKQIVKLLKLMFKSMVSLQGIVLRRLVLKLSYRFRYYKRKVFHFFGFCPNCYSRVNISERGMIICPKCRKT